jgi:hypothetical protein
MEREVATAATPGTRLQDNSGTVCACPFFLITVVYAHPSRQSEGINQGNICSHMSQCSSRRTSFASWTYYAVPYSFEQGTRSLSVASAIVAEPSWLLEVMSQSKSPLQSQMTYSVMAAAWAIGEREAGMETSGVAGLVFITQPWCGLDRKTNAMPNFVFCITLLYLSFLFSST